MNNFDSSSTGVNIEGYICADTFLAQYEFDDEVKELYNSNNRDSIFLLTLGQFNEPYMSTKRDLYAESLNKLGVVEYIPELMQVHEFTDPLEFKQWILNNFYGETFSEALYNAVYDMYSYPDYQYCKKAFDFRKYSTKGYCQGDVREVIIPKEIDFKDIETYIDHLFWDSPITGEVNINGGIFSFEENISDRYNLDNDDIKKEFINNVFYRLSYPELKELKKFLGRLLPKGKTVKVG